MQKKVAEKDYYDVDDPFIDDSELAIDERTYFAQTKQKGFYVSSGEVALMRDKPCVCFTHSPLLLLISYDMVDHPRDQSPQQEH